MFIPVTHRDIVSIPQVVQGPREVGSDRGGSLAALALPVWENSMSQVLP